MNRRCQWESEQRKYNIVILNSEPVEFLMM
ncbi:hypothetical protein BvCmsHHP056_03085 [Escherichia coli]|nr:hypothetical protein BvCmsHHP056_03085 [Escherichia coli]